ncbi:MAG: VCBS repeat-containing protein [Flavobacteriaceae bacterium]|nr:VCBS repeat-containing protein [Flavobacteriaceae bacterium]
MNSKTGMPLRPILLMNRNGSYVSENNRLPEIFLNGSVVCAGDMDNDGDLDLFIGGASVPKKYGEIPNSYLLENNGKGFF